MGIFTSGWFDWLDNFPIVLQLQFAFFIAVICITAITFSLLGIKRITKWWITNIKNRKV